MLLALSVLIFILLRLTPGDPIDAYIDPNIPMSPEQLSELRSQLGLDKPLPVQYLAWLQQAIWGISASRSSVRISRCWIWCCRVSVPQFC